MTTLISLGTRGVNLDRVTYWEDKDNTLTVFFGMSQNQWDKEQYTGAERTSMLRALTLNSMEYFDE